MNTEQHISILVGSHVEEAHKAQKSAMTSSPQLQGRKVNKRVDKVDHPIDFQSSLKPPEPSIVKLHSTQKLSRSSRPSSSLPQHYRSSSLSLKQKKINQQANKNNLSTPYSTDKEITTLATSNFSDQKECSKRLSLDSSVNLSSEINPQEFSRPLSSRLEYQKPSDSSSNQKKAGKQTSKIKPLTQPIVDKKGSKVSKLSFLDNPKEDASFRQQLPTPKAQLMPKTHAYLTNLNPTKYYQWKKNYQELTKSKDDTSTAESDSLQLVKSSHIKNSPSNTLVSSFTTFYFSIKKFLEGKAELKEVINLFNHALSKDPLIFRLYLEIILQQIESLVLEEQKKALLTELLGEVLHTMKSHELFIHEDLLKIIALNSCEIYIMLHSLLQEAYSEELIEICRIKKDHLDSIISAHHWFIPTSSLIEKACQKAAENQKCAPLFLNLILHILNFPTSYPLSSSTFRDIHRAIKSLPNNPEIELLKQQLLLKISSSLIETSPRFQEFISDSEDVYQQNFTFSVSTISESIVKGKVSKEMIDRLAWDLKKIDALHFAAISVTEFSAFKQKRQIEAPNIKRYIEYMNTVTYLTAVNILSSDSKETRARWCDFYIQLMQQSLKIGNLNAVFMLLGAFESAPVARLKETWALVPKKRIVELEKIKHLFSQDDNQHNYWQYIKSWEREYGEIQPKNCLIPIFVNYLKYLTFIDDGNPNHLISGHLNPEKIRLLGEQHTSFQKFQNSFLKFSDVLLDARYTYNIYQQASHENVKVQNKLKGFDNAFSSLQHLSLQLEIRAPKKVEKMNN